MHNLGVLGMVLARLGKPDQAVQAGESALATATGLGIAPYELEALLSLGWTYTLAGRSRSHSAPAGNRAQPHTGRHRPGGPSPRTPRNLLKSVFPIQGQFADLRLCRAEERDSGLNQHTPRRCLLRARQVSAGRRDPAPRAAGFLQPLRPSFPGHMPSQTRMPTRP